MKIITIPAKTSNSGTINDIAKEHEDRKIKFRNGCKYAIVWASYYGDIYKTFKTAEACGKYAQKHKDESFKIIDDNGIIYGLNCDELFEMDYLNY